MRCGSVPTKAQKNSEISPKNRDYDEFLLNELLLSDLLSAGFKLDNGDRLMLDARLVTKAIQPVNSRLFSKPIYLALSIMARFDSRRFERLIGSKSPFDHLERLLITDRFERLGVASNPSGQQRANLVYQPLLKDTHCACIQPLVEKLARRRQSDLDGVKSR